MYSEKATILLIHDARKTAQSNGAVHQEELTQYNSTKKGQEGVCTMPADPFEY